MIVDLPRTLSVGEADGRVQICPSLLSLPGVIAGIEFVIMLNTSDSTGTYYKINVIQQPFQTNCSFRRN